MTSTAEESPRPPDAEPMATEGSSPPPAQPKKGPRPKAQRTLPTDRIAFTKQIEIVRAYGQLGMTGRTVTNADVAQMVSLHPSTTSLANGFFAEIGFLQRTAEGQIPAPEVIAFAKAFQWNKDVAASATKLAPLVEGTWFGAALIPKVRFRNYSCSEALGVLADISGASPGHKGQLESLLELLALAGLIQVEGDSVRPVHAAEEALKEEPIEKAAPVANGPRGSQVGAGQIAFQVSMSVTMAEITALSPDKIAAFFSGIAEVMKIQAELESLRKRKGEGS